MKRFYFTCLVLLFLISDSAMSTLILDRQSLLKFIKSSTASEITDLKLSGKKIIEINETALHSFVNLEFLDLSHNQLTTLPSMVFRGLSKLERISLYFNYITHLDPYTFYGLTNLKYLDLERNQITQVQSNTFKGLKSLWYLDFDSNNLTQLNTDILSDLKMLKYFFVKNNNITFIENGFIERFNKLCLNFFYFQNNRCLIDHQFSQLNQSAGCIRINSSTCELFHYEKITARKQQQWVENEKEIQILRYQVRSFKEISKNDLSIIEDFKKQLEALRSQNNFLTAEAKNHKLERETLTNQIISFSAKRQKDQEIIDTLVSERDDVLFLNGYLEDELKILRQKDWEYQKAGLQNEVLKKEVSGLNLELSMLRGNLTEFKAKRQINGRIMRSLMSEVEKKKCSKLNTIDLEKLSEA